MTECLTCLTSSDQLARLVIFQQRQIDRLTGGRTQPAVPVEAPVGPVERPEPSRTVLARVEAALASEDIYRRPPRVAAPRLIEALARAGITLKETP